MLSSGDWMVPTFNDRLRPDKPVGIYWLMANSVRLFGVGEWAVRMWAGVGIATAMLLVAAFVRRRVEGANPGLAAVVLGLAPLAFVVGTAATTDAVLLAATTGAMVVLADGLLDRWTAGRVVLLGVLLGAGLLIKGPVALAVTGLAIGLWVVLTLTTRDTRWRTDLGAYAAAAVIGLAIFLAWAVPANAASGGELARLGLGHHVVNRMQQPLESHGGSLLLYLPYYPLVLLVGLMPWTLYLPGAIAAVWRRSLGEAKVRRLLLSWALPTIVLMTLVATKLPHYVLPVVPALAVVIAIAVPAAIRKPDIATGRWWVSWWRSPSRSARGGFPCPSSAATSSGSPPSLP
jgi:4-amino-4-deoxy-L-arabinose transferase-like glycosyltransferase